MNTPLDISVERAIPCERGKLFSYIATPENFSKWQASISGVQMIPKNPITTGDKFQLVYQYFGRPVAFTFEVETIVNDQLLSINNTDAPFPMTTMFEITAVSRNRCKIKMTNRTHPTGIRAYFMPLFGIFMRRAMASDLKKLSKLARKI